MCKRIGEIAAETMAPRTRAGSADEWRRHVGWLYPTHNIAHRFTENPRERSGQKLAWWRLLGPETRCPLRWRRELRVKSLYALSSVMFAPCGLVAVYAYGAPRMDAVLLGGIALTSYQSDVTYLGIDHAWRTLDTVLAVMLVLRYVALAVVRASRAHAAAVPPFALALLCFLRSQRAASFLERATYQACWHAALQASLLVLLRAEASFID